MPDTVFTLNNRALLAAAVCAATDDWHRRYRPALTEVLCEVGPDGLRLVATDTHVLGALHLRPGDCGLELGALDGPRTFTLPVATAGHLLRIRRRPAVTVRAHDDLTVTVSNSDGTYTTLPCRAAGDFPAYRQVIPSGPCDPRDRASLDAALLARFAEVAKALGVAGYLELEFRAPQGPVGVRLRELPGFYGLIMPLEAREPLGVPAWLAPAAEASLPAAA